LPGIPNLAALWERHPAVKTAACSDADLATPVDEPAYWRNRIDELNRDIGVLPGEKTGADILRRPCARSAAK
jgi:hypothetical protein